jgi:poly(ADP-ribose) glycohydrolase ARH3
MIQPATLTGLAVGDSLGMPFETDHFSSRRLAQWDGSFQASAYHKLDPGQWTDDTQMATALTRSLLSTSIYDPHDASTRYVDLWRSGNLRGAGSATKAALGRLVGGIPWISSGSPSSGNGAAMRIAPLGLFYHNHIEAVSAFANLDAGITHNDHEAQEGSKAIALAVATLAQGRADRDNLLPKLLDWLGPSTTRSRLAKAASLLEASNGAPGSTLKHLISLGTGAYVVESVPAAFLAFCGTTSFKDAIETAIQAGGDTDSVAAMAGALAGTHYGTKQVDPYIFDSHSVGLEDGPELRDLELALFNKAPPVYG